MTSVEDYRTIAENCMRKADAAMDERDKPLWAAMAQSWLRLAQHRERIDSGLEAGPVDLDELAHGSQASTFN